jgi:ABC-type phosphate/phosphonate transport system substrate-binding protein
VTTLGEGPARPYLGAPVRTLLVPPQAQSRQSPLDLAEVSAVLVASGLPLEVQRAADTGSFERAVEHAEVAVAWSSPVLCARVEPTGRALLTAVRQGNDGYRSALVARADAGLNAGQLQGKRVAWTTAHSTAGHLLPAAFLKMMGFRELPHHFAGSYRAALLDVLEGRADVAAVYTPRAEGHAVQLQLQTLVGAESAGLLVPLAFTEEIPGDALAFTAQVSPAEAQDWTERLLQLPAGHALLRLLGAERLVRARDGAYRSLRSLLRAAL